MVKHTNLNFQDVNGPDLLQKKTAFLMIVQDPEPHLNMAKQLVSDL